MEIYSLELLHLAGNISHIGLLPNADAVSHKSAQICGSKISVSLKLNNGVISDFGQEISACALGQASAALLAKYIIGLQHKNVTLLSQQLRTMLSTKTQPDWGEFSEFTILHSACEYKARHGAILLPFLATLDCLEQLQ